MLEQRTQRVLPVGPKRWVPAILVVLAGWTGFIIYLVLHLQAGSTKWLGGFFLAIGMMNLASYKRGVRRFFARTQSSPHYSAKFWASIGEEGLQLFFLGIGAIFVLAGCVLLIVGSA